MTKKSVFFSMKLASLSLGPVNWAGLRENMSEQLAVHEKGDFVHYVKVLFATWYLVLGTWYTMRRYSMVLLLGTWHLVLGTGYLAHHEKVLLGATSPCEGGPGFRGLGKPT